MSTTLSFPGSASELNPPACQQTGWSDRIARRLLLTRLGTLTRGNLVLSDSQGVIQLGDNDAMSCCIHVRRPEFYRHAVLGGSLSIAESYLRGDWDCDNLTSLFRIFVRNISSAHRLNSGFSAVSRLLNRVYHACHANSRSGSRRNIHAHYDLGNEFFRLMLDETMAYSSGVFLKPESTLYEASVEKMDRICRKLELRPDDHLLEIGTGWGGMAVHAAENYGCRVTTTTISRQQYEIASFRIAEAGLSDRITLLLQDYRDLTGQFDKLVSVEMIEAVGFRYLDTYFSCCSRLLKPEGSFVLQSILMPDQGYSQYLKSVDFIQKYIFPGGCLPSMSAILSATSRVSDLKLAHAEDFGPHYARTLREWRQRFHVHREQVRNLGYPERFIRMWDYYLSYCEATFEERYVGVVQLQLDKPGCRHQNQMVTF